MKEITPTPSKHFKNEMGRHKAELSRKVVMAKKMRENPKGIAQQKLFHYGVSHGKSHGEADKLAKTGFKGELKTREVKVKEGTHSFTHRGKNFVLPVRHFKSKEEANEAEKRIKMIPKRTLN